VKNRVPDPRSPAALTTTASAETPLSARVKTAQLAGIAAAQSRAAQRASPGRILASRG